MKTCCFICWLLLAHNVLAQDYRAYQRTFNRIDSDLLAADHASALVRLDSISAGYEFVFARHCIKALQICCAANDSIRAEWWLTKAFRQGVPLYIVRNNGLMKKTLSYANTRPVLAQYDSLHVLYQKSVNHELRREIDSLIVCDQQHTKKVNDGFLPLRFTVYLNRWRKNNVREFNRIREITEQIGYPGERLIGLPPEMDDSTTQFKNLDHYGPDVRETHAYIMLIHYFSDPRRDINVVLLEQVVNGNIPPDFYAAWNDFLARWGKGRYGDFGYYNA